MKKKITEAARRAAERLFKLVRRHPVAAAIVAAVLIAYIVKPWLALVVIAVAVTLAWYRYRGQIRRFFKQL